MMIDDDYIVKFILKLFSEFPAFQQHILDNGIVPVVYSIAKNDTEPYTRASALKCLSEMIRIKLFWENGLCNFDILVSF